MPNRLLLPILCAATALLAGAATAEVTDRSPAGFETVQRARIAAPPARVFAALQRPADWWSSQHSWSGDARNLTLDLKTGCFCETLPGGGFARHMTVVNTDGTTRIVLEGALGPLVFTGASGHLAFALKPDGSDTILTVTYDVGGYAKGGLAEQWAAPVDGVLGEQVARLKRFLETGKPD